MDAGLGWGGGGAGDLLPGPPKADLCGACQLIGTPKLISHQRLLRVLLYRSLARLLDKLPGTRLARLFS